MAITMTIFQHHANGVQKVWIRTANAYGMATLQRPRVTRTGVASSASLSKLTELRHKEGFNLTLGITGIRCATAESEKQAISAQRSCYARCMQVACILATPTTSNALGLTRTGSHCWIASAIGPVLAAQWPICERSTCLRSSQHRLIKQGHRSSCRTPCALPPDLRGPSSRRIRRPNLKTLRVLRFFHTRDCPPHLLRIGMSFDGRKAFYFRST